MKPAIRLLASFHSFSICIPGSLHLTLSALLLPQAGRFQPRHQFCVPLVRRKCIPSLSPSLYPFRSPPFYFAFVYTPRPRVGPLLLHLVACSVASSLRALLLLFLFCSIAPLPSTLVS
ncbi:hypothetical protein TRVL_03524 [Trypanosoma vivax]|nr:hypothetical protein TRVL_03524 [Trypanosoma vivax]